MNENENDNQTHDLAHLRIGRRGTIRGITEPGALGERLLELGLTPGTEITVVRRGLFGDPVQVALRGSMLSIRKAQAHNIEVELLP